MDFYKLAKYQQECESQINIICQRYNQYTYDQISSLCREIGYQTRYTKSEAIDKVEYLLQQGKSLVEIAEIYNVKWFGE